MCVRVCVCVCVCVCVFIYVIFISLLIEYLNPCFIDLSMTQDVLYDYCLFCCRQSM